MSLKAKSHNQIIRFEIGPEKMTDSYLAFFLTLAHPRTPTLFCNRYPEGSIDVIGYSEIVIAIIDYIDYR